MKYLVLATLLAACGSVSNQNDAGTGTADACVAETIEELCGTASCEPQTFTDRCGQTREVDCGACDAGLGCVVGTCKTPVCASFNFSVATLPAFSRTSPEIEDTLGAVTPDGSVVVTVPTTAPSTCGNYGVVISDEVAVGSGTYTGQDITTKLMGKTFIGQDGWAITSDGLTLIARAPDSKKFVQLTRSAKKLSDFTTAVEGPFTEINAALPASSIMFAPVISADGLEFLYTINTSPPSGTPTNSIYSAVRASTTDPFPVGTKLGAPLTDYAYASALSSDRLTVFVFDNFSGRVFTRTSTTGAWVNPNAPAPAPLLGGWQQKPLANCQRMFAMGNAAGVGGCLREDILLLTRQ